MQSPFGRRCCPGHSRAVRPPIRVPKPGRTPCILPSSFYILHSAFCILHLGRARHSVCVVVPQRSWPSPPGALLCPPHAPRAFTPVSVAIVCSYGVLLMLPVLISLLVVSVVPLGLQTLLIPVFTFAVVTLFLPFCFGNPYLARLARSLPGFPASEPEIV